MSKFGSSAIKLFIEATPGGTSYEVTDYILTMGSMKITSATEPSTAFGDSWEETIPAGLKRLEPFELEGHFEQTATSGAHAIFYDVDDGPSDDGRGFVCQFSSNVNLHTDVRADSYELIGAVGKVTRFKSHLIPTGTVTWTTSTS